MVSKTSDASSTLVERNTGDKYPALWFSANAHWEPTATKMAMVPGKGIVQLTMAEQHLMAGCARISIESTENTKLITWAKYRHKSGLPSKFLDNMEMQGEIRGAKSTDWYCQFESVPKSKWVQVELWDGQKWEIIPITN